jgi:hypothetical protein
MGVHGVSADVARSREPRTIKAFIRTCSARLKSFHLLRTLAATPA